MHLFVYGLLKSEFENKASQLIQKHCRFIGDACMPGYIFDVGDFPGAVFDPRSPYKVYGELYEVLQDQEKLISELDHFEEIGPDFPEPQLYRKEIIQIPVNQKTMACLVYIYNLEWKHLPLITKGIYEKKKDTGIS